MFKGVWATRLEPDAVEAAIDERIAWFRERNAPFFFWWTGPSSRPAELGQRLLARGLIGMEEQSRVLVSGLKAVTAGAPAMAADLGAVNEDALAQVPEGFAIDEVHDEAGLEGFRRVFVEAYELPEFAAQAWVDATRALGIGRTPWRLFLGRLDGEAVATNMLFNGGGVASVYAVGTVPALRGQGIGGAITLAPLLEARTGRATGTRCSSRPRWACTPTSGSASGCSTERSTGFSGAPGEVVAVSAQFCHRHVTVSPIRSNATRGGVRGPTDTAMSEWTCPFPPRRSRPRAGRGQRRRYAGRHAGALRRCLP
jgi:hypothetical protein